MLKIFWRTVKDRKLSLPVYSLAALLFMWMYVALFPSMQQQSETFQKAFQSMPEAFFKAFGIESLGFSTIEQFLAIEHFSIIWPIMAIIMLLAIAGSGLAGEVELGTVELLLSRPVSRLKVFTARYLVGLFSLFVFTVISVFAIIPLSAIYGIDYNPGNFVLVAAISFLFGWAVFSIAILFSAIFSERSRVYMISGGIVLVMYVFNIVASLSENLEWLKFMSFFYYYDYNSALIRGTLNNTNVLLFVIVAFVFTFAAAWRFGRRDIAV